MGMHRLNRHLFLNFDWVLLLLLLLICGMALVNLYSASFPPRGAGFSPYQKQALFFVVGFCLMAVFLCFDYSLLHWLNYPIYLAVILLLLASYVIGQSAGGAQRWIDLGFFKLQPSEPAKLMLVITLASYYARKEVLDGYSPRDILAPMFLTGVPFLLIVMQPDLGTSLMLAIIFICLSVFVRLRFSTYAFLFACAIGAVIFAWNFLMKPYQKQRVETFLNPSDDRMGSAYQITQSKIAVGSGGQFGRGYLEGTQGHLHFLPERHTDFAFSVWCEEWGFWGSVFFLGIYFFMLLWGIRVAMRARDRFGMLLAFGVVMLIFWQAVINILMILGFLPVVGIPLPMVSYGGSSLLTTLMGLAVLMNVSMRSYNPRRDGHQDDE